MPNIYKLKVYLNSTQSITGATYLQDTFVTLLSSDEHITDLPTSGNSYVVNSDGSHGVLYDKFLNDGIFNFAMPYVYDSRVAGWADMQTRFALYFQYALACGVDVATFATTSYQYLIFTTDASDYFICVPFYTYNEYGSPWPVVDGGRLYLKTGAQTSTYANVGRQDRYSGSDRVATSIMFSPVPYPNVGTNSGVIYVYDKTGQPHVSYTGYALASQPTGFYTLLANDEPYIEQTDPYAGAGDSTTGGGDGTFDGTSDPVPVPSLPSVGAQDSGFITLFAPTAQQMKDLAHFMWVNPLFDLSAFKKIFADPMDCILGLSVVPVSVPTSGAQNVNIGNLVTSVTMNVASQQYIEVDCGTVTMDRFFGSYLDFEPYTKISLFLPYCGTHSLSMDDIAGKTIGIVYHIDILTGSCIAFVKCGDSVLYEFNGACGSNIPVNSLNFASTIENAIRIAVNIGTTVATAGASAPITTGANAAQREAVRQAQQKATAISLAGSTAEGALSMKPNVSRSGALGGGVGILGHQIPYFIITRPRLCKPAKQDFFQGYPSFIQTTIGDLIGKGFTSFTNVIIAGQYLTDEEETELESILESGVYL